MTHQCRNCGSSEIYTTELAFQASRPMAFERPRWPFEVRLCADCGLSDLFLAERYRSWAKKNLEPVNAASGPSS
jgi:predicted nucleic-acid-binding Zn-ribbon protein